MILSKSEQLERERIIAAIGRLNKRGWLPPDVAYRACQLLRPVYVHRGWTFIQKFALPQLMSEQSEEQYKEAAIAKFLEFLDSELWKWRVSTGGDEPAGEVRKRRGPGKTGRNAGIDESYEWAALRFLGLSWKQIAGLYKPCKLERELATAAGTIRKAANVILRRAGIDHA